MDTTRPQTLRARPGRFGSRGPLARLGLVLVLGLLLAPAAQASDPTTKCGIARMALDARRAQDELRCIVDRHVALVRGSSIADSYAAYQECRIAIQTRFEERATRLDERDEQRGRCALPSSYSLGSSIALEFERAVEEGISGTDREEAIVGALKLATKLVQSQYKTELADLKKPDDARRTQRRDAATERFRLGLEKLRDKLAPRGTTITVARILAADDYARFRVERVADTVSFRQLTAARDALVAYWPFDADAPGANRSPTPDPRLDLALRGNATTAPGFFGDALSMDGNGDYAAVTDTGGLARLAPTAPFTITGWFRARGPGSNPNEGGILFNKEGEYEMARFANGTLSYAVATQEERWRWIAISSSIPLDDWVFFVLNVDEGSVQVAFPGGFSTSYRETFPFVDQSPTLNEFRLGGRPSFSQYFDGEIDEVAFWSRSLTIDELIRLYNGRQGVSLQLLFELD
ncbi:MAG: LamG domain-containing protein [Spirochaetaceae bacterium]|nr:LamG domain-containing protein [Myxococcales bacterium]MCB9725475.1 LamG domain-containing protein [Spirochaetaceae bacterium]HPG24831.1 LamG domain-containing protein [Myxococcota bacterium]